MSSGLTQRHPSSSFQDLIDGNLEVGPAHMPTRGARLLDGCTGSLSDLVLACSREDPKEFTLATIKRNRWLTEANKLCIESCQPRELLDPAPRPARKRLKGSDEDFGRHQMGGMNERLPSFQSSSPRDALEGLEFDRARSSGSTNERDSLRFRGDEDQCLHGRYTSQPTELIPKHPFWITDSPQPTLDIVTVSAS